MQSVRAALGELLSKIDRPGNFHVSGHFAIHPPNLEVEGVGPVALPLLETQAKALIDIAEQAPYGRGTETLVDTQVRRTWQIDANQLNLSGQHWQADLDALVERIRQGLGVAGRVQAQLYKLLIYDAGSFFTPHRDTEKVDRMFATLVVVMPGRYTGGALLVRHRGEEVRIDLQSDEPAVASFAAFYADCVHEVQPVTAGHRLALVFNLIRTDAGPMPTAPDYRDLERQVKALLQSSLSAQRDDSKLVFPLEHAYSRAELAFDRLKGRDNALASLLINATQDMDVDLHLALMTIEESGYANYVGAGWDDDGLEIGEVIDSDWRLHDWQRPDGAPAEISALGFFDEEVIPADALDDLDETDPEFSEATGNEGASFERFYQRAALVLWPSACYASLLAAEGPKASLPALEGLVARWQSSEDAEAASGLRDAALTLADAIIEAASRTSENRSGYIHPHSVDKLLASLLKLEAIDRAWRLIEGPMLQGKLEVAHVEMLTQVLAQSPVERAEGLLLALLRAHARDHGSACIELFARCIAFLPVASERLQVAGRILADALVVHFGPDGDEKSERRVRGMRPLSLNPWSPGFIKPEALARGIIALVRVQPEQAERILDALLANPQQYDPDGYLLPLVLQLVDARPEIEMTDGPIRVVDHPACQALRQAVLAHLETRIQQPLEAPTDWTRSSEGLSCRCKDCKQVRAFLASPVETILRFQAVEAQRKHVQHCIQSAGVDLDLSTHKQSRPYTLVCRKNQASYERRVIQREEDLAHRAQLLSAVMLGSDSDEA